MNIKITKSSYKTKDNRRAIIFDCSTKNYRKKINTRVLVDDNYFENPNIPIKISLKITIEKIEEKKRNALEKYLKNDWSFKELENYLKKGIDIYSIEEYVKNDFVKNKNMITGNDYLNVIKVFKKHLNKMNISFDDLLENNTILEFKLKALRNGVKVSSINSYLKKIGVIMNKAYKDGIINKRFEIPKYLIETREKVKKNVVFEKKVFIDSINNSSNIYHLQSISIILMLIMCGGMSPSNMMNYSVYNNYYKSEILGSLFYNQDSWFLKFKKSNKGNINKYVGLDHSKMKIIEIVKTLFYLTHYNKFPHIIAPFSVKYKIFEFNIQKNNNLYRNIWNFYQFKIREISDFKFSHAKIIYYDNLKKLEMNKITSDILFGKIEEKELITLGNTNFLKESIENVESQISKMFSFDEIIQVILNKSIFLGVDLNLLHLNKVKTPIQFSSFLKKINTYRKGLKKTNSY